MVERICKKMHLTTKLFMAYIRIASLLQQLFSFFYDFHVKSILKWQAIGIYRLLHKKRDNPKSWPFYDHF